MAFGLQRALAVAGARGSLLSLWKVPDQASRAFMERFYVLLIQGVAPGVRAALASALLRDGELWLARAARVAEMDVASFINQLGRLGIAVIRLTAAETGADLHILEQWLQSILPTPAP